MNRDDLKLLITRSLRKQGFQIRHGQVVLPPGTDKDDLRSLHEVAVRHRIDTARPNLARFEPDLLRSLASGTEVDPPRVAPRLVQVRAGSRDELLFRYASLHWSIPVSSGYGRRLRFLVVDDYNGKLIGLFGLGDPVFSLGSRDDWIGWNSEDRRTKLQHVLDAFILGAVPPYSRLLCGKLVALLATSNEVRAAFSAQYRQRQAVISGTPLDGRLALITTTSALGRSSIYNRLRYKDQRAFQSVGFTKGSGGFHFSNGLYGTISTYASRYCEPSAKKEPWGTGFRNRREVIKKCLSKLGLPGEWIYHGVHREVFVAPLARNSQQFLRGDHSRLQWHDRPSDLIADWFRDRWLLPRSQRTDDYKTWDPSNWRLWT